MDFPEHPDDAHAVSASRIHYAAGEYPHAASGLFQLRVVRSGSSYAQVDLGAGRRQVFTRPGDILVSLGDRPIYFAIEEGRDLCFVQASAAMLDMVLDRLGAARADLLAAADRPFRDPLIADLAVRMEELAVSSPVALPWAFGVLIALALDAARRKLLRVGNPLLTARRLANVLHAIAARLDQPVTVAELAGIAGMRERGFSAAFRDATGLPVYQFILRKRVDRAVELLGQSGITLAEVAQRSGFTHQAHMTRTLKRLKGRTPTQIRSDV